MLQHFNRVAQPQLRSLTQANSLKMEVVFGTPSQNCIGSGICMVMNRLPNRQQLRCPHAPAWLSYEQGLLVFRFSKSEVLGEQAISRFASPWFLVQEPFQVPRHCARQLGIHMHWVSPGVYKITDTLLDWVLAFQLKPG